MSDQRSVTFQAMADPARQATLGRLAGGWTGSFASRDDVIAGGALG